ncbi:multiheme c-type cytochrome [Porticoccaceae bacterium]|nr:multiheme c-type cytochrome [Porticoccaceae bacterium]
MNSQGANYIGAAECAGCHQQEFNDWQGSHHDWAMKIANPESVLGDFNNVSFSHGGVVSTFTRSGNQYYVTTQGADGQYQKFKIDYSFGVTPLQQYLISFPDGRIQALTTAWDSRPKAQGGQRWYQLMPDDKGDPGDSLHWTGAYYNWNSRCAECHSTGLQKNYSATTDSYATIWSEINVACESCHGPGSDHLDWAQFQGRSGSQSSANNGLKVQYGKSVNWVIASGTSIASAQGDPHQAAIAETQSCAGCHSRRSKISQDPINNHPGGGGFLDHYRLQTLQQDLYHADGQIQDEVYVYGSFVQSKMYQRGVTCSNCHNPHSLELVAQGNDLCAGCHAPETYDQPSHHFHKQEGSSGAQCVNCHMPATLYMGVDARRDHSMRIPRPDISQQIDAPNACNNCHRDQSDAWSASAIQSWIKDSPRPADRVATTLSAARTSQPTASQLLIELADNSGISAIARATALGLLASYPDGQSYSAARQQLKNSDPLIRLGALEALAFLPLQQRWQDISPLLNDQVASVRHQATQLLLGIQGLNTEQQLQLDAKIALYMEALRVSADMPNGQLNIASAHIAQGQYTQAQQAYLHALRLDGQSLPALLNLADLDRARGLEQKAMEMLMRARASHPDSAMAHHVLGLAQIRSKQTLKALSSLQQAWQLAPDNSRYAYVYALALNSQDRTLEALKILTQALNPQQPDRDLLFSLATMNRDLGRYQQARDFANKLVVAFPQDSAALRLRDSLK